MPGDLDRFNRIIRNLYTAQFERAAGTTKNRIPTGAELEWAETMRARVADTLGYVISRDKPTAWLRFNHGLLDLGAQNNKYVDSASPARVWQDRKATVWYLSPTWEASPRVQPSASLVDAAENGAMLFTGTSSGAHVSMATASVTTLSYTVEFLIHVVAAPGGTWDGPGLTDTNTRLYGAWLRSDAGVLAIKTMNGTGPYTFGTLSVGQTYHVMVAREYNGSVRGYINGILTLTGTAGTNSPVTGWAIADGVDGLEVALDEVALYTTALSEEQCLEHYAAYAGEVTAANWDYAPAARYYEAMQFSGSDVGYDSSATYMAAGSVTKASYYSAVCDETKMWGVMRLRPRWAYTDAGDRTLFLWSDDANNRIILWYDATADQWKITRLAAGAGASAAIAGSHAAYDHVTLAFMLTATDVAISLDGGAWTSVSNTNIPTLTEEFWEIGSVTADIYWMALGVGTLDDEVLANLLSDRDPYIKDFGDALVTELSFLWYGTGTEHVNLGSWGESLYV